MDSVEDVGDDSRDDAELFIWDADFVVAAHGVGFAGGGLTIGQNSCVVSFKASIDEILSAFLVDVNLF